MCGSDYCETCTPDAFMVAWTLGRHHTTPTFGDGAQQWVATSKRKSVFEQLLKGDRAAAMEFPEFLELHTTAVCQFADLAYFHFDRLVARVTDFADYVRVRPETLSRIAKLS
jgi:hypothetical protein